MSWPAVFVETGDFAVELSRVELLSVTEGLYEMLSTGEFDHWGEEERQELRDAYEKLEGLRVVSEAA